MASVPPVAPASGAAGGDDRLLVDVDALDRVLTRLALTDEERLSGVLEALLPRLLAAMPTPAQAHAPMHATAPVHAPGTASVPAAAAASTVVVAAAGAGSAGAPPTAPAPAPAPSPSTATAELRAASAASRERAAWEKCIEILSHIKKRVENKDSCQLPVAALLDVLCRVHAAAAPFVWMYIKMGLPRLPPHGLAALAPTLLQPTRFPPAYRSILLQWGLTSLQHVQWPAEVAARKAMFSTLLSREGEGESGAQAADAAEVLEACMATLLFVRPTAATIAALAGGAGATPAASAAASIGHGTTPQPPQAAPSSAAPLQAQPPSPADAAAALASAVSPGMSARGLLRVLPMDVLTPRAAAAALGELTASQLAARKRAVLKFAGAGVLADADAFVLAIAAAADVNADVVDAGDELAKRLPGVNLEDAGLLRRLSAFVLGAPSANALDAVSPAPNAVRTRVLNYLSRSRTAATTFPMAARVVFECWFGAATTVRLRLAGVKFAVSAFQLADLAILRPLGPAFLQGLLKLLALDAVLAPGSSAVAPAAGAGAVGAHASGTATALSPATATTHTHPTGAEASAGAGAGVRDGSGTGAGAGAGAGGRSEPGYRDAQEQQRLREHVYSAIGTLAARVPTAFASSLAVPKLLFAKLGSEDADVRLSVSEALSMVAGVYRSGEAPAAVLEDLHGLLEAAATSSEPRVRQAALDWAVRVFPFSDVRARYICIQLVGDPRVEVRELARNGLRPYRVARGPLGGIINRATPGFRGADGDADRADLAGIARRSDPTRQLAEGTGASSAGVGGGEATTASGTIDKAELEGADEPDDAELVADEATFATLARAYPAYSSLLRFFTQLDDDEDAARSPQGSGVRVTGAKRALEPDTASEVMGDAAIHYVDQPDGSKLPLGRRITQLSPLSIAAALEFINTCLDASAVLAGESAAAFIGRLDAGAELPLLHAHRSLIEYGLDGVEPSVADAGRLHEVAAGCLAQLLAAAPHRLCTVYAGRLGWTLQWLRSSSASIRASMAAVLGTTAVALPLDIASAPSPDSPTVAGIARDLMLLASATDPRAVDLKHGGLLSLGFLLGRALPRSLPPATDDAALRLSIPLSMFAPRWNALLLGLAASTVISQLGHRLALVREAATVALSMVARQQALPMDTGDAGAVVAAVSAALSGTPAAALPAAAGIDTRAGVALQLYRLATGQLTAGGGRAAAAAPAEAVDGAAADGGGHAAEGTGPQSAPATEGAAVCLGALASGELRSAGAGDAAAPPALELPPVVTAALHALLGMRVNKYEQVQFTVGAALVEAVTAVTATVPRGGAHVLRDDPLAAASGASGRESSAGAAAAAAARRHMPAREQALRDAAADWVVDAILAGPLQSLRAHERTAAAVWLLALVHTAGSVSPPLRARLPVLQAVFSRLLMEKSQFTQECAAKGLALVYEASDAATRKQLVSSLVESLSTGKRTAAASSVVAASAAGAAAAGAAAGSVDAAAVGSAVGPGPAGLSLSAAGDAAYKELCSMANELGQPDLIYRFLALSAHHAAWHTRGGAGFGLEALLRGRARREVEPYLKTLIPKLFRYQYDPSQRVRESMSRLWSVLVRDPKAAVDANIHAILRELIVASESANWREREAACSALADVLSGRGYDDVAPELELLWRASLRAIDDLKDSVRETALTTLKTLGRLTVRLCDPAQSSQRQGAATVAIVLPFLLHDGVTSPIKDAQTQCLSYLREVVKVAGPLLRPYIPDLVKTALSAMSSMESDALSHLQMHADAGTGAYGEGLSGEKLEGKQTPRRGGRCPSLSITCLLQTTCCVLS